MRPQREYYRDEIDPNWRPEYERDHHEDRHREDRHREDRHREDRHPEDRHREDRHPEDRHREERHPDDRLREDRHHENRHREDRHHEIRHREDRHPEDRHREDRLREDRHPEDRLREDRHHEVRHREDRHPEDRLREDRHREDRHPEDRLREDLLREDRHHEARHPEDRLREDRHHEVRHHEDRHHEARHPEDRLREDRHHEVRHHEDRHHEVRHREDRHRREHRDRRMVKMTPLDDHERKIIIEFCHLLEKSKQLFNGLRELPPYGHKQWQSYFGRTFDVYTKLWKFQQQHRLILDTRYGLKRWQIGEIASKIGQLYYHFYLRTSETAYLREAFAFYHAIRGRSYYTKANREDKCELMVKKLRYYARFIVVAILLKKSKLIKELVRELDRQVIEYGATYDPEDQAEWNVVLEEVKAFLVAEPGVAVIHPDNPTVALTISGRVNNMTIPPIEKTPQMYLTLQDAVIIGSGSYQVKFSELTIDMFRILQNLEREAETPEDSPHCRSSSTSKGPALIPKGIQENGLRPENPHKYLLFKPSPSQVLIYLASSCNDLTVNGAILIYISADGYHPNQNKHPEDYGYDIGGLITTSKSDIFKECNKERKDTVPKYKEQQILYPGDLQPFTRKPLFIIVDSDNSYAFQHIPRIFGQPLVILMSPLELPVGINDRRKKGGLFTLYLHNPIAGLCNTCDVFTLPIPIWDKCIGLLDVFMKECIRLLVRVRMDPVYLPFLGDDYLRLLVLRYIFCECTLRLHKGFRARSNLTRAAPPLPDELFEHRDLVSIALEMTGHIGIRNQFYDATPSGPLPSRE